MKMNMHSERYLIQHDAALLSRLAENMLRELDVNYNKGEQLLQLLTSAILLPENVQKEDCVTLYSDVLYRRLDTNEEHAVTIVCPYEAVPALARISALAPLALALIGVRIGGVVTVELLADQSYDVQVTGVKSLRRLTSEELTEQTAS